MSEEREIDREFDIVIYGATGFVGKLTAEYLAKNCGDSRVALAGRSADKLRAVRDSLGVFGADWHIVVADASDQATLNAMAARTRVVVTTVGPYAKYGLPLVEACAAAGTDYVDLTGEPQFIRASIDNFHKQAVDTGARIVHSCGFDSIPSDLNVFALHRKVQEDGTGELGNTTFVVRKMRGGVSGGTIASMLEIMDASSNDPEVRAMLGDPYLLSTDRGAEPDLGPQPDTGFRSGKAIAPELAGEWTTSFAMGLPNTRTVRRSNSLLDWAYGRRFKYSEAMSVGSSPVAPVLSAVGSGISAATSALGFRYFKHLPRPLVDRVVPKPGTGPSEKTRQRGFYKIDTYTTTTTGARYVARIAQKGDPGYQATAVLLGESALALAYDRDKLSDLYGVLTPAAAMGDALLARFPKAGVSLHTVRLS